MNSIKVSDATRATFDKHARAVAVEFKQGIESYGQDLNASATSRTLRELLGLKEWPNGKNSLVMEVLKLAGNASANRQRLNGKTDKSTGLVVDYSNMA